MYKDNYALFCYLLVCTILYMVTKKAFVIAGSLKLTTRLACRMTFLIRVICAYITHCFLVFMALNGLHGS